MAILLDVYLGVPIIYSTFMQYDELGHHFGPSSFQALRDLRRTDARIREIRRMIDKRGRARLRPRDPVRPRHDAVGRAIACASARRSARRSNAFSRATPRGRGERAAARRARASRSDVASTPTWVRRSSRPWRRSTPPSGIARCARLILRTRDWVRSKYGLRELILPEKYRVEEEHDVVVTYSSCLALAVFRRRRAAARPHRHRARSAAGRISISSCSITRASGCSRRAADLPCTWRVRTGRAIIVDGRARRARRARIRSSRTRSSELVDSRGRASRLAAERRATSRSSARTTATRSCRSTTRSARTARRAAISCIRS